MREPNEPNLSKFTNWAKMMYDEFSNRTCNTFIISGNIGDYAVGNTNLKDYLLMLLSQEDCFAFDEVYEYELANDGVCLFKNPKSPIYKADNVDSIEDFENNIRFPFLGDVICETSKLPSGPDFQKWNRKALIISYPEKFISDTSYDSLNIQLHKFLSNSKFFRSRSMVIFITNSRAALDPNKSFFSNLKTVSIDLPLPDLKTREKFYHHSCERAKKRNQGFSSLIDESAFAKVTAGLTLQQIEDLVLACDAQNPITLQSVLDKKRSIIQSEYSNIIELMDASSYSLNDFAGQENVKEYFKDVVIDAVAKNKTEIIPKGVLLMGPPGTGKSFFAKCLAGSAGMNCVEFKMSKILDKYVGVAEQRLDQAFRVFHAMAPVIVFIDELDQALSRGNSENSHQLYSNIFSAFLTELSNPDNRGKIIWLGATNYPNHIDEALKRAGRFDKKIPFFAPNADERALVLAKHIQKAGTNPQNISCQKFAEKINNYTQAEIEAVVVKAYELAARKGKRTIANSHIETAIEYMISANNNKITEMENIALLECNDLEFVPVQYRNRRKELFSEKG